MKNIIFLALTVFLVGCEERYRYPCQDPDNWEKKECKVPYCSANGTCPEDLTVYEKDKANQPTPQPQATQVPNKGGCK